ncbi:hypothetical protein ACP26L_06755 [Paenibacillus sp. S-38]|uniref:hypothetical protein n=1 Tax=Paenibacillus sp. S-38 TaxID=3416710 RepID=UPI003CFA434B
MPTPKLEELDGFEYYIIKEILNYRPQMNEAAALKLFEKYRPVLYALDDYSQSPAYYAHEFCKASEEGFTPNKWLEHIQNVGRMYARSNETSFYRKDVLDMLGKLLDEGYSGKTLIAHFEMQLMGYEQILQNNVDEFLQDICNPEKYNDDIGFNGLDVFFDKNNSES